MTDETDRPAGRRRGTRLAVAGATLALGLGALGLAATGAFADGGASQGSSSGGAATTFVQDGTTTPEQQAPDRGDCPGGSRQGGDGQGRRRPRADAAARPPRGGYPWALVAAETLSPRALNRALLARQLLLGALRAAALEAVEHLVGLQAQEPLDPYTALWSRLSGFRPESLADLLEGRRAVRIAAMRGTIHLVSAEDCLALRALMQPVLDAELSRHPAYAPLLAGVDLAPVMRAAREALAEPRSTRELRAIMREGFPEHDAAALAYACRCLLPLVQVPPRGVWGRTAQVTLATAESWLGRRRRRSRRSTTPCCATSRPSGRRRPADAAAWSRLPGMRAVLERLRPRLRTFRDERGRELFDLPDAPRPDPGTPAPVRFLPEYDNVLLSHADRSRVVADADRARLSAAAGIGSGSVLVDGVVRALWRLEGDRGSGAATLVVTHTGIPKRAAASVAAEGRRLLRLVASGADGPRGAPRGRAVSPVR